MTAGGDFGWAVIGPGKIAQRFGDAVQRLAGMRLVAVHSRDAARAQAFVQRWSDDARGYVELAAMLADPRVDGVYIATPHGFHAEAIEACLRAGKAVLCEKSMAPSAALAAPLIALARERGVFLMEALWTRALPAYDRVGEWLAGDAIGPIRGIQSSFMFDVPFDPSSRLFDPAQAGGALLDIGIYNIAMTQFVLRAALGYVPALESLETRGLLAPTGVDLRSSTTLHFAGGIDSQFQCGFDGRADNGLRIFGEHGFISVPTQFWQPVEVTLQRHGEAAQTVHRPFRINGFEYQIERALHCIARGEIECAVMPHADTLAAVSWIDRIRGQLGARFPFD